MKKPRRMAGGTLVWSAAVVLRGSGVRPSGLGRQGLAGPVFPIMEPRFR